MQFQNNISKMYFGRKGKIGASIWRKDILSFEIQLQGERKKELPREHIQTFKISSKYDLSSFQFKFLGSS